MTIEVSKEETELYEKKIKRERMILLVVRVLILVIIFASTMYYMFFYKPNQKDIEAITSTQKFLKKEEINQLRNIINTIEKTEINKLNPSE